jgi:hypothetical protein
MHAFDFVTHKSPFWRTYQSNDSEALSSFPTCEVYSAGFGHIMSEISGV